MNKLSSTPPMLVAAATVCSALVAAVLAAVATPLRTGDFSLYQLGLLPILFMFSLLALTLIGLPLYFLTRKWVGENLWAVLSLGLLGGALVSVIIRLPSKLVVSDLAVNCPIGMLSALVFWLVLRWKSER